MGLYGSLRPTYRIAWMGRGHRRCAEAVPFGSPGVGSDSDVSGQHDKSGVSAARLRAAARPPSPGPARGAYPSVATEAAEPAREPYPHRREHLRGSRPAVRGAYLLPDQCRFDLRLPEREPCPDVRVGTRTR